MLASTEVHPIPSSPLKSAVMHSPASLVDILQYLIYDLTLPHLPSIKALALVVPLYLQAWFLLVRQTETTRVIRLALIPFGIYYAYTITLYDFEPRIPFRAFNFIKNVAFPVGIAKTLELGLVKERYRWIGYDAAYAERQVSHAAGKAHADREEAAPPPKLFSVEAVKDAFALMISHRGHGWNWGVKGDLILPPFPQDTFLKTALLDHVRSHALLIASISLIQYSRFPLKNDNFLEGLGIPAFPGSTYLSDAIVAIVFGTAVWNFLDLAYMEVAIAAYLLHAFSRKILPKALSLPPFDSRAWPPLLQNPLRSSSLADWWTYRWHSILRREFIIVGFKPARYLTQWMGRDASSLFGVLGAFAASGLLHEIALYTATNELPLDTRFPSMKFFMCQGLGLVVEQVFTRVTGKKVGGWPGRFWLLFTLGFPGAEVTKAWLGRGLIESQPTPGEWEWWRWAIPALVYLPRLQQ